MTGDRTPLREQLRDALEGATRWAMTNADATTHRPMSMLTLADAVLPVVEAETAALRERAVEAERHREQAENRAALFREQVRTEHERAENAEDRLRKAEQAYTQLAERHADAEAARDRWRKRAEQAEADAKSAWQNAEDWHEAAQAKDKRAEEAERKLAELERALNWQTSCLACSRVLDSSYAETVRAEKAEAAVERARELARHPRTSHGRVNDYVPAADLRAALDRPEQT